MKYNWEKRTTPWKETVDLSLFSLPSALETKKFKGLQIVLIIDQETWKPLFIVVYPDKQEYQYLSSKIEIEDYRAKHGEDIRDDLIRDHLKNIRKQKLIRLNEKKNLNN